MNRLARRGRVVWPSPAGPVETGGIVNGPSPRLDQDLDPEVGNVAPISPDVRAIAQSNNRFAFEMYQHLQDQAGNKFFSPSSISTALAMTYAGAEGATKQQMAGVLHFDLPDRRLHEGFGKLNTILNSDNQSYRLQSANRLWVQSGFHFEPPFLNVTREHYGAEPGEVDFAQPEKARQTINQWIGEKTSGKIGDLIPPGLLHDKIRLVLTNAIYFKGTWKYKFSKPGTSELPFHLSKDRDIKVPTMQQTGAFFDTPRPLTPSCSNCPTPCRPCSGWSCCCRSAWMDWRNWRKKLTADDVEKWIAALNEQDEVEVYLPKFTFTSQIELKEVLTSLGMPLAFSDEADFSGISTEKGQKLYDAIHQAFIDVNEEGTEAAAATGGIGGDLPGPVPQTIVFRADHPFLFLIRDNRTGAILFLGRVVNPK